MVGKVADQLPTAADELLSSLGFGEGECDGAVDVVGETSEVVGKAGEVVGAGPLTHSYSTVKSRKATADPSSAALSHGQPRPS